MIKAELEFIEVRKVVGYEEEYAVTADGQVFSYRTNKFLKKTKSGNGYYYVVLSKNGNVKHYRLNRLVAEAFIPNPLNLSDVDHRDGDKSNNCVKNLQWLSHKENVRKSTNKSVLQYTVNNEFVAKYDSIKDASEALISDFKAIHIAKHISSCLKGKYNTAYGYIWRYADDSTVPLKCSETAF